MENKNILLFKDVKHIIINSEVLYSVEGLLKYFSHSFSNSNFLIQNLKKSYSNLQFKKIKFSSSYKYYVNTVNALKLVMHIDTEKSQIFRQWMIKCAIERVNEIISPMYLYDRLRTIIHKKGVKSNYSFVKAEIEQLDSKINYVELDQKILDEDLLNNKVDLKYINEQKITVVKLPRSNNSTKFI